MFIGNILCKLRSTYKGKAQTISILLLPLFNLIKIFSHFNKIIVKKMYFVFE